MKTKESIIHLSDNYKNKNRKFGECDVYYQVKMKLPAGDVMGLFTLNDLERAVKRAIRKKLC